MLGHLERHAVEEKPIGTMEKHGTNNIVEHYFEKVKKDLIQRRGKRMRPGLFIRSRYISVVGHMDQIHTYQPSAFKKFNKKRPRKNKNEEIWRRRRKQRKSKYFSGDYQPRHEPKANNSTRKRASRYMQSNEEPQEPTKKNSRKTDSQEHGKGKHEQGEHTKSTTSDCKPQKPKWQNNKDNLPTWGGNVVHILTRSTNCCIYFLGLAQNVLLYSPCSPPSQQLCGHG